MEQELSTLSEHLLQFFVEFLLLNIEFCVDCLCGPLFFFFYSLSHCLSFDYNFDIFKLPSNVLYFVLMFLELSKVSNSNHIGWHDYHTEY